MINQIIKEVERVTGITYEQMASKSRKKEYVIARQGAMHLIKKVTKLSLKRIGEHFGNRDHSTVIYALDAVEYCPSHEKTFDWINQVKVDWPSQDINTRQDSIGKEYLNEGFAILDTCG